MGEFSFSTHLVSDFNVKKSAVHRTRISEKPGNAVVYGNTSDGIEFRFWRIDNDSVVGRLLTIIEL